jgi:hypothetical protein
MRDRDRSLAVGRGRAATRPAADGPEAAGADLSAGQVVVGADSGSDPRIDDVGVWSRVLSAAEVARLAAGWRP